MFKILCSIPKQQWEIDFGMAERARGVNCGAVEGVATLRGFGHVRRPFDGGQEWQCIRVV